MKSSGKHEKYKVMGRSLVVGGLSAAISKTIVGPIERIKIILQVQSSHPDISSTKQYNGIWNCAVRLWTDQPKSRSILVKPLPYWRGNVTNVIRYFPMQAVNFAVKSRFRDYFYSIGSKNFGFWGDMWRSCASGGLAGIVGLTFVYPLDLARTRMTSDVGTGRKYKGLGDCMKKVTRVEGPFALYKGFVTSICGIFPYRAAYFGFYDLAKRYIMKDKPEDFNFFSRWAISQSTSVISQFVAYPHDTVRRRMMLVGAKGENAVFYKSGIDCFFKILKEEGVIALYHGAGANVLRATGCALCLVFYDNLGKFLFLDKDYGSH